jgi:hypothetical protein
VVSPTRLGCAATVVGALVVGGWGARAGMSDPGCAMVGTSPLFFAGGFLLGALLRGAAALVARRRRPPADGPGRD